MTGTGGTCIIVGPGHDRAAHRRDGVHVFQSETHNILVGHRIIDRTPGFFDTVTQQLAMGHVGQPARPCRFIVGKDVEWNATAPRGLDGWRRLASVRQEEAVRRVDKAWTAMLLPLGIAKGKAFDPDERQQRILLAGAAMGQLMARNPQVNPRFAEPHWKDSDWYKRLDFTMPQEMGVKDSERALVLPLDERRWDQESVLSATTRDSGEF